MSTNVALVKARAAVAAWALYYRRCSSRLRRHTSRPCGLASLRGAQRTDLRGSQAEATRTGL